MRIDVTRETNCADLSARVAWDHTVLAHFVYQVRVLPVIARIYDKTPRNYINRVEAGLISEASQSKRVRAEPHFRRL